MLEAVFQKAHQLFGHVEESPDPYAALSSNYNALETVLWHSLADEHSHLSCTPLLLLAPFRLGLFDTHVWFRAQK